EKRGQNEPPRGPCQVRPTQNSLSSTSQVCQSLPLVHQEYGAQRRLKRTRIAYSCRSRGSLRNNPSSFSLSSRDSSFGSRRNSHTSERNSFRWATDSFALYARVIFFRGSSMAVAPRRTVKVEASSQTGVQGRS